jgi:adenylate cyclase
MRPTADRCSAACCASDRGGEGAIAARRNRLRDSVPYLLAAVIALLAQLLLGPRLDGISVDLLHWVQAQREAAGAPERPRDPVVVIALDEETYRREPFKGTPVAFWTREVASVLDGVVAAGASVVGFDVIFPTTVDGFVENFDRELRLALRAAAREGKVVLGKVQHQTDPIEPFPGLIRAVSTGESRNVLSTNMFQDPDDVIRRVPLFFDLDDGSGTREPSMALELAARHLRVRPAQGADGGLALGGRQIAGSRTNNLLVRFPAPLSRIATYSFADLAACAAGKHEAYFRTHFAGRVVLLGTVLDVEDRKRSSARFVAVPEPAHGAPRCALEPMHHLFRDDLVRSDIPGVLIHAAAIANLLHGDGLREAPGPLAAALLVVLTLAATWAAMRFAPPVAGAIVLGLAAAWAAGAALAFESGVVLPLASTGIALALAFAGAIAWRIVVADREKRFMRRSFSLYLAPSLVDALAQSETPPRLGGEAREITAMFCDLAGFTAMSEDAPPERVVETINIYFSAMTEIVEREGGFVDKFVGDAIVAVFGAPVPLPDHARRAVRAALAFRAQLEALNATAFKARPLAQRIGLATGTAIVGNIGSGRRFNYTAIGDVMNLASRLEAANKEHGTKVLCAAETRAAAGDEFAWTEIARFSVRGRRAPVTVYEPGGKPLP